MAEYKSIKGYKVQSYAADSVATAATAVSGSPAGTSLLALKTGGTPQTSSQATTEEWSEPVYTIKTVTVS